MNGPRRHNAAHPAATRAARFIAPSARCIAPASLFTAPAALLALALLAGCCTGPPTHPPYTGPTEPMAKVVEKINLNNQPLRTLFAYHNFGATLNDGKKTHRITGTGVILYRKPFDLRMNGSDSLAGRIFDMGCNEERYWLAAPAPGPDEMWWGYFRNLGKPCAQQMPIRPDAVMEVLGVGEFADNFLDEPAPVMRFDNDGDAYVFVWSYRGGSPLRWIAQKEIWYDRASLRPVRVLLYQEEGRIILRAQLSEHQQVAIPNTAQANWPWMAMHFELRFPDSGSAMNFTLQDVALSNKGAPNDRTFVFPENAGVSQKHQIDEGCGP